MKRDMYQEVTDRIIALLEAGTVPWAKEWASIPGDGIPMNAISNRPYSGINVLLYWISGSKGYSQPRYLTYNQARAAGGHVRKGERGETVILYKPLKIKDKATQEEKTIPLIRGFTVFNVEQCEELPDNVINGKPVPARNKDERNSLADEFVKSTGADFREGKGAPMYVPSKDFITTPSFKAFNDAESYYATTFHELAHWTGHKNRLDRNMSGRFGTDSYAMEELVAELTSAFLCAEFGFNKENRSASYLASWIKVLKSDKKAIFSITSQAQKAADYLRGKALADEQEEMEEAA
mgnify:CR=1 FL=1